MSVAHVLKPSGAVDPGVNLEIRGSAYPVIGMYTPNELTPDLATTWDGSSIPLRHLEALMGLELPYIGPIKTYRNKEWIETAVTVHLADVLPDIINRLIIESKKELRFWCDLGYIGMVETLSGQLKEDVQFWLRLHEKQTAYSIISFDPTRSAAINCNLTHGEKRPLSATVPLKVIANQPD